MIETYTVPLTNPEIIFREEFDDWAILFDPDSGKAFGLNPVGALIWKCLDGKQSLDALEEKIKESFSDIPEDMESHLKDFLKDLVDKGFAGYEVLE